MPKTSFRERLDNIRERLDNSRNSKRRRVSYANKQKKQALVQIQGTNGSTNQTQIGSNESNYAGPNETTLRDGYTTDLQSPFLPMVSHISPAVTPGGDLRVYEDSKESSGDDLSFQGGMSSDNNYRMTCLESYVESDGYMSDATDAESFDYRALVKGVNKKKKKKKHRPGELALKEIKKYQATTKMLMLKLSFARVCKSILSQIAGKGTNAVSHFSGHALAALQQASERHIVSIFEDANLIALRRKRVTIFREDLQLARRIRDKDSCIKN